MEQIFLKSVALACRKFNTSNVFVTFSSGKLHNNGLQPINDSLINILLLLLLVYLSPSHRLQKNSIKAKFPNVY